jgi:hypothetical protein
MPAFENADVAFASGTSFLQLLKPPLLLHFAALPAGSSVRRNGDPLHPEFLCRRFVGGGEESGIGRQSIRRVAKQLNMLLQRGNQ